jgi:uncharacterized protein YraI
MKKLLLASTGIIALLGSAQAETLVVQANDGYMNIRSGPGTNYSLVGTVPNGKRISWSGPATCVRRQDGIVGADWCKVNVYNGQLAPVGSYYNQMGWVSRAGLMPVYEEEPAHGPEFETPEGSDGTLTCDRPQVLLGDDPRDPNPVIGIELSYSPQDHAWRIFHHQANGGVVSRSEQYAIVDNTSSNKVQWSGSLNRNRSLFMVGEVKSDGYYYEWLYNRSQGNRLDMQLRAKCHVNNNQRLPGPTSEAAPPAPSPAPLPKKAETVPYRPQAQQAPQAPKTVLKDSVPIYPVNNGNVAAIDVLIGGNPIRMLLDTGAEIIQIPPDLAEKIVREHQGSWGRIANFRMADGHVAQQRTINIESVRIGSHTLHNVTASVSEGTPIMAFPVVNSIAPFRIDTRNRELVFDNVEAKG